jgi:hypothetical protein
MIVESLLQEQSTAEKVRDLQKNYLFVAELPEMENEYKQGKWGSETQKQWVQFLEDYSDEVGRIADVDGKELAKDKGWSKQNKYAKSMSGVLEFMKDVKEIIKIDQEKRKKELEKTRSEDEGRKEGAKDTPKKKEKPKPKLRYSEPSGNTKTSIDPLRIPASQIESLNTRIRFSNNTMMSAIQDKSWWGRYAQLDGRTVTDQEIKNAAISKVNANDNISDSVKKKITKETRSSLGEMKGRALPVKPMVKDITEIDVVIFRDYEDYRGRREIMDCAVVIRYLYKDFGDPTPIPLIAITNLKYSKKQGVYAMTKVNESKNKLDSKLLRRLILKTLKEHGEL